MMSGLAIYNFRYSHDLSHIIFDECSNKAGEIHVQIMTLPIFLSLFSTGIVIYWSKECRTMTPKIESIIL